MVLSLKLWMVSVVAVLVSLVTLVGGWQPVNMMSRGAQLYSSKPSTSKEVSSPIVEDSKMVTPPEEDQEKELMEKEEEPKKAPTKMFIAEEDDLSDVRERIRRRAADLNLRASSATPDDYDAKGQKNIFEQMVDQAMEEEEIERRARKYSDGKSLVQGAWDIRQNVTWPTTREIGQKTLLTIFLTLFMTLFVLAVDHYAFIVMDQFFHYPRPDGVALP